MCGCLQNQLPHFPPTVCLFFLPLSPGTFCFTLAGEAANENPRSVAEEEDENPKCLCVRVGTVQLCVSPSFFISDASPGPIKKTNEALAKICASDLPSFWDTDLLL